MKRILATILVVALSLFTAQAQVKVVTVHAEGKCELSRHITLEQAEQKALQEAKQAALNKAGVDENVWSVFGMITENDGQQFQQAYSEMSILAVGGLVLLLEDPIYTEEYSKTDKRTYVVCKIHAEVKRGETVDKSFQIKVDGIAPVYKNDELFNITITSSQDAYLNVFWFNHGDGLQLLPNKYEPTHFSAKGTQFILPKNSNMRMRKQDEDADTELVNLMIVATKKDYPFYEDEVSFESLLNWIYDIPASERCAVYESFYIK